MNLFQINEFTAWAKKTVLIIVECKFTQHGSFNDVMVHFMTSLLS